MAQRSDAMNRRSIFTISTVATALFLIVIGILHGIVNVSSMSRAVGRGEIPARLEISAIANAAFSGAAMCMLGLLIFLALPGLRAGSRQAHRLTVAIGLFLCIAGLASYLWMPTKPLVLIFLFFGALLAAPLLIWRRDFSRELA
jgi:hypothetical protein